MLKTQHLNACFIVAVPFKDWTLLATLATASSYPEHAAAHLLGTSHRKGNKTPGRPHSERSALLHLAIVPGHDFEIIAPGDKLNTNHHERHSGSIARVSGAGLQSSAIRSLRGKHQYVDCQIHQSPRLLPRFQQK